MKRQQHRRFQPVRFTMPTLFAGTKVLVALKVTAEVAVAVAVTSADGGHAEVV